MSKLPNFCPACGRHHALLMKNGHPHCDACGVTHWENDRPVAVMMLRVAMPQHPDAQSLFLITASGGEDDMQFPAGFVEMNESAEAAAVRELREETGIAYVGRRRVVGTSSTGRGQLLVFVDGYDAMPYEEVKAQFTVTDEAKGWSVDLPVGFRHALHREFYLNLMAG